MQRVTGIGGIFFKSKDPEAMKLWYRDHLGIDSTVMGCQIFEWREAHRPDQVGQTVWSLMGADTTYLSPGTATFMINYRVENLDWLMEQLEKEGVWIDPKRDNSEYGKFAWIQDPEGNRIELWEPPHES